MDPLHQANTPKKSSHHKSSSSPYPFGFMIFFYRWATIKLIFWKSSKNPENTMNCLHLAAEVDKLEIFKLLMRHGM